MRLAQPPGIRSTSEGASQWFTPPCALGDTGMVEFLDELPATLRSTIRGDLKEKRDLALRGRLHFCECNQLRRCGKPSHDVKQSQVRPRVLELRWDEVVDDEDEKLGVAARLYFTEPEGDDVLTYLLFRAKYPQRLDWREQQTDHMCQADDVITGHYEAPTPEHDE